MGGCQNGHSRVHHQRVHLVHLLFGYRCHNACLHSIPPLLRVQVYGYEYGFRWWALLIVASYTVGFTVLAVVFLKYVSFLKR